MSKSNEDLNEPIVFVEPKEWANEIFENIEQLQTKENIEDILKNLDLPVETPFHFSSDDAVEEHFLDEETGYGDNLYQQLTKENIL